MENDYTVADALSPDELERIRSLEEELSQKHQKPIALVAYERAEGSVSSQLSVEFIDHPSGSPQR